MLLQRRTYHRACIPAHLPTSPLPSTRATFRRYRAAYAYLPATGNARAHRARARAGDTTFLSRCGARIGARRRDSAQACLCAGAARARAAAPWQPAPTPRAAYGGGRYHGVLVCVVARTELRSTGRGSPFRARAPKHTPPSYHCRARARAHSGRERSWRRARMGLDPTMPRHHQNPSDAGGGRSLWILLLEHTIPYHFPLTPTTTTPCTAFSPSACPFPHALLLPSQHTHLCLPTQARSLPLFLTLCAFSCRGPAAILTVFLIYLVYLHGSLDGSGVRFGTKRKDIWLVVERDQWQRLPIHLADGRTPYILSLVHRPVETCARLGQDGRSNLTIYICPAPFRFRFYAACTHTPSHLPRH